MDDIEWIRQGLKKPGKSKGGLAKAFGRSPSAISDLLAGTRQLKATEIKSAAEYLEVNPPGMSGDAIATQQIRQAPVRGVAAAGLWMEYDDLSGDAFEPIPVIPTKYTHDEQFAYKIAGPSMDKERIFDGDYVVCVPYWEARAAIQSGDTVVIELRDGAKIERTCKKIDVVNGGFNLCPQSTDQRFQKPIHIPNARSPNADDGLEVEIVGLVIGVYSPR